MEKAVGYLRIRTARKGAGSLGIDAKRGDIAGFCRANGYRTIAEFIELEGARCTYRPSLHDALTRAKAAQALLVIARLEHLSRNLAFTMTLLESGVDLRHATFRARIGPPCRQSRRSSSRRRTRSRCA